jgi:hypothetical protein
MVQKFSTIKSVVDPVPKPAYQPRAIHPTEDSHVVLIAPRVIVTPIIPKKGTIIQAGVMMPNAVPLFGMASNMGTFMPVVHLSRPY